MSTPLGDAVVVGQATKSSDRPGAPDTRLRGRRLILARVAWLVVVSLIVALFLAMLPAYYTLLQTVCTGVTCAIWQPTPGSALALQKLGFSVGTYATILLALTIATAFVCFAISAVIFWRKSDDWMALLVALGAAGLATVNVTWVLMERHSPWQVLAIVLNILGNGLSFLVGSLFPNGLFVPRWTRWLLPCWLVTGIVYLFLRDVSFMYLVQNLVWLAVVILLVIALLYRYHSVSSPLQRQQTKWFIFGICVAGIINVGLKVPTYLVPALGQAGSFYQLVSQPAYIVAMLIIPLCLGFAILRFRLYDIDIIIRRTLVYSTLTVVLAVIYELSVNTLQSLIGGLPFIQGNQLAIVASSLLVGFLFQPVHDRTHALIDRRFYRRKYDAARTVAAFSATIRDEVDLNQLCSKLVEVVEETMQPAHVSLWLRPPEHVEITHEALLDEWGQLKEWIREDLHFLKWYQKFQDRFQEWVETNALDATHRDADRLLRGRDLSEAEDWLYERVGAMKYEEQAFIRLSCEQRTREEEYLKTLLEESERQRQIALGRNLAAQAELLQTKYHHLTERSVLLAIESIRRYPSPEANQALRQGIESLRRRIVQLPHDAAVIGVAFSPDGRYLATACKDFNVGIWEIPSGRRLATLTHQDNVLAMEFSRDGHLLATGCMTGHYGDNDSAMIWEIPGGHCLASLLPNLGGDVHAVKFSPNGRFLIIVSGYGSLSVWETTSGHCLASMSHGGYVNNMVLSSDGRFLATAANDDTAGIWEIPSGRRLATLVHKESVYHVALSPDEHLLATASDDHTAKIWEFPSGRHLETLAHDEAVSTIAFSPDGHVLATASRDHMAKIWEISSGQRLATLAHEGIYSNSTVPDYKMSIVFSPDGHFLVTASKNNTAEVWETITGRHITTLPHESYVNVASFTPSGLFLATASLDGVIGLWELSSNRLVAYINHEQVVNAMAFSPDGKYLATASSDKTARLWIWQPEDLIVEAGKRLTRNLTLEEWQQYIGNEPYRKVFPHLP
jgi:WD40 repeat protein